MWKRIPYLGFLLVMLALSSCATKPRPWFCAGFHSYNKMYTGPYLPESEVCILFTLDKGVIVNSIDGVKVHGSRRKGIYELLPGLHTLTAKYFMMTSNKYYVESKYALPLRFVGKAGNLYGIRANTDAYRTNWEPAITNQTGTIHTDNEVIPALRRCSGRSPLRRDHFASQKIQWKYVSEKGIKVFHNPECRWVKEIEFKNLIGFTNRKEAIDTGLKPCLNCNP